MANVYNASEEHFLPALILERFYGQTLSQLKKINSPYYDMAKKLHNQILEETKKKGINIPDPTERNVMINLKTKELILLDSDFWEFTNIITIKTL